MQIQIVTRDTENGHHDVYVNGKREYCLRGTIADVCIRYEGTNATDSIFRYSSVSDALKEVMEIITGDYIIEAYTKMGPRS